MKATMYQLCVDASYSELTSAVNDYLKSGQPWQIYGEPFCTTDNRFCQAVVCVEESPENEKRDRATTAEIVHEASPS